MVPSNDFTMAVLYFVFNMFLFSYYIDFPCCNYLIYSGWIMSIFAPSGKHASQIIIGLVF